MKLKLKAPSTKASGTSHLSLRPKTKKLYAERSTQYVLITDKKRAVSLMIKKCIYLKTLA